MGLKSSLTYVASLAGLNMREIVIPPDRSNLQVHSISDIHVDYAKNLDWFRQQCQSVKANKRSSYSVLLLPGDIASIPDRFKEALEIASDAYDSTFLCPGNHELWHTDHLAHENVHDSLDKLEWIHRVSEEYGVHTKPAALTSQNSNKRLFVVPLLSWYHSTWDKEPDLPEEVLSEMYEGEQRPAFVRRWADFRCCKWPEKLVSKDDFVSTTSTNTALADHFAAMNEEHLDDSDLRPETRRKDDVVISFSHFLPRQELCPEKRFLIEPYLSKVIGSEPLGRQVKALKPNIHLFGHTHIPLDLKLDGIRYLQWPLGSLNEQNNACAEIARRGPILVYDQSLDGLQGVCVPTSHVFPAIHHHPVGGGVRGSLRPGFLRALRWMGWKLGYAPRTYVAAPLYGPYYDLPLLSPA